jgi:hypothetical protein
MNAAEFSEYFNSNNNLDANAISAIECLLKKYPFSSFLHMLFAKMLKISESTEAEKYIETAAIYLNDRKKLFRYLNDIPEETFVQSHVPVYRFELAEGETTGNAGHQNDIIDKFLNEKPSFSIRAEASDDSEEPAYDPEIISETLAEIYLKQGKTEIAISTYEKLCLKYPEKSTYFAARIEKIKKELLNNY